jgi:uncharacterized oligopeptide transporter (OPT) family protein
MSIFQKPPSTPEELEAARPLELSPEEVLKFDEAEWYARAYRGDAPQLTARAIAMGTVLGFFLSFTNVYIGLKTGWFLGVALTACILSYAIWSFLRTVGVAKTDMTILENNCMQSTASSAGYATGNVAVSAIPALLLLTVTDENRHGVQLAWPLMALWVLCLATFGVVLAIPMKRNLINREKLKFPSGTAAAVTLQGLYSKGDEAMKKARALLYAALASGLVPLLKDLEILKVKKAGVVVGREALLPPSSNIFNLLPSPNVDGRAWKWSDWNVKLDHGVVLIAAGAIIGIRITGWMVLGGLFVAVFLGPLALETKWTSPAAMETAAHAKIVALKLLGPKAYATGMADALVAPKASGAAALPKSAWKEIGIWFGAPLLVASGLVQLAAQWRTIVRAISGMFGSAKKAEPAKEPSGYRAPAERDGDEKKPVVASPDDVEVPTKWFLYGLCGSGLAIIVVAALFFDIPPYFGLLAVGMTFVLALVSARATGESDITPGGAMGKIMQLTYGVLIPQSTTANLMTASITSGAGLATADLLNDLKSGYLLGANPRRQFLAQAMGILTGTIATTLGYFLLVPDATVLTGTPATDSMPAKDPAFPAPGAQQWLAVAKLFKTGTKNMHPMAVTCIKTGLIVGAILALVESLVPKKHKKYVPSPTGLGLGMILPFFSPFAMFLGAVLGEIATRANKAWAERYVVPLSAGVIAGESIVGVIVAGLNNFVLN